MVKENKINLELNTRQILLNNASAERSYIDTVQSKYGIFPKIEDINLDEIGGLVEVVQRNLPKLKNARFENVPELERRREEYIRELSSYDTNDLIRGVYNLGGVIEAVKEGKDLTSREVGSIAKMKSGLEHVKKYVTITEAVNNINIKLDGQRKYGEIKEQTYDKLLRLAKVSGIGIIKVEKDLSNAHDLLRTSRKLIKLDKGNNLLISNTEKLSQIVNLYQEQEIRRSATPLYSRVI